MSISYSFLRKPFPLRLFLPSFSSFISLFHYLFIYLQIWVFIISFKYTNTFNRDQHSRSTIFLKIPRWIVFRTTGNILASCTLHSRIKSQAFINSGYGLPLLLTEILSVIVVVVPFDVLGIAVKILISRYLRVKTLVW